MFENKWSVIDGGGGEPGCGWRWRVRGVLEQSRPTLEETSGETVWLFVFSHSYQSVQQSAM